MTNAGEAALPEAHPDPAGRRPRVSIGLPVYNGARFVAQAIESILGQTFTDFELVISDNASTDQTPQICERYAASDPRVRYSRNAKNIGGANNTNLTFRLSRGEYFRWAAHDDVCDKALLESCVDVLDRNPDVVLCYPDIVQIDENGNRLPQQSPPADSGTTPFSRFRFLSSRRHACEAVYGLMRASVLRRIELIGNFTDADRVLLCEIGFHGALHRIPRALFYKRRHTGNQYKDWRGRMAWYRPELAETGSLTFPFWSQYHAYFRAVHRAPMSISEKAMCDLWLMGPWLARFGRGMAMDVVVAAQMLARSKDARKKKYGDVDGWA
ncbi:MAG TPA: glycosyltransferase [Polyangiaceae bacterium]|nr:glycosyltransferase [Polyangiaceae bacterium]